ncbi:MAG: uroporphyrinogen-III synthase [Aquificaceae bacterium]
MKIALTRSQEDTQKDKVLFEREGFEVFPLPLIEEEALEFEIPSLCFDYVIFQSQKAVRHLLSKHKLKEEKIVVVGEKTKKAVEDFGYRVWAMPESYYGEEIVKLFEDLRGRVLVPRSAVGRDEVIEGLKGLGLEVYAINIYRVKEKLYDKDYLYDVLSKVDALFFASPSAVKGLFANLQKQEITRLLEKKKVLCIGKTTKDFLRKELSIEALMPKKPTIEEVVKLLKKLA